MLMPSRCRKRATIRATRLMIARLLFAPILCWIVVVMAQQGREQAGADGAALVRGQRRLALLVGVGKYYQLQPRPGYRPWPELHTATEIEEYRQVLIRDYDFAARDVMVLLDAQATTNAIRKAFREHLIAQAAPGSLVLFHYSGHGQHLPDDADPARRDEPDGMDESLVTYDALDQSVQEGVAKNIRDDELGDWLEELAARMRPQVGAPVAGNITVTLDTCFSGSATRGALVARGRPWDVSQDGPLPPSQPWLPAEGAAGILARGGTAQRDLTLVAAARADQTAWERDGRGVFTRHWVRLLARADKTAPPTYQASVDRLALDLSAEGLEQVPQVEGAADRPIFSSLSAPGRQSNKPVRALRRQDGALWLQAGEVHGITVGSQYWLYDAGELMLNRSALLGQAEVVEVSPFMARLAPIDEVRRSKQPGALAIEARHAYSLSPLRVMLIGFASKKELIERIEQMDIVHIVGMKDNPNTAVVDHDLALHFRSDRHAIDLLRPDSIAPYAKVPPARDVAESLAAKLVAEWRQAHFASLRHENQAARVEIELIPVEPNRGDGGVLLGPRHHLPAPLPSAHIALPQGKAFGLRLHNRSARDLFATVIAVSPDGDINVLFGSRQPGKNRIRAGESQEPPLNQVLFLLVGKPQERIVIKVIATEDFVDFSGIESPAVAPTTRSVGRASQAPPLYGPLQQLLDGISGGVRGGVTLLGLMEWGTTDASVTIE